jgi:oligopeptide transport system substrate-binding protein
MANVWKSQIGLEVQVKEVDPDAYLSLSRGTGFTIAVSSWTGDYADPLTFLQLWTSDSNLNDARFSDADYDAAVQAAVPMTDTAARYKKLAEAEQILLTKAAIIPLGHSASVNLIDTNAIGGWFSNPLDVHPFKFLRFKSLATPPNIAMAR